MNREEYKYYFGENAEEDFAEADVVDPKDELKELEDDEDEDEDVVDDEDEDESDD